MIGSSGDAGNILYFSTGQYDEMKRIWTQRFSTSKFISPIRFWRVMDIDYLVDTVFKKQEPLDTKRLNGSSIKWFVPISDFNTGQTRYVNSKDKFDPRYYEQQLLYRLFLVAKYKLTEGNTSMERLVRHFKTTSLTHCDKESKKILVINHTSPWTNVSRAVYEGYAAHTPHGMHDAIIRDISTNVFHISAPGATVIVVAPQNLPAGNLTRNQKRLKATFDRGVSDVLAIANELNSLFQ